MMTCHEVKSRLGELLDGELDAEFRQIVEQHLVACAACRDERDRLHSVITPLERAPDTPVPSGLWDAIRSRLDGEAGQTVSTKRTAPRGVRSYFLSRRTFATAAAVILAVGLGWVVWTTPWTPAAEAARIDFRPLLDRADGDIEEGINTLLQAYGGETVTLADASQRMKVRIHPPAELPGGLRLKSVHLLKMGRHHQSLAFHFDGPAGQLLLLQCPANVQKQYGNYECISCQVGAHAGHVVRAGPLRLTHMESENVCVCVVATLDESHDLPAALDAVKIDF